MDSGTFFVFAPLKCAPVVPGEHFSGYSNLRTEPEPDDTSTDLTMGKAQKPLMMTSWADSKYIKLGFY